MLTQGTDKGTAAETTVTSDEVDKEPLLGFKPPATQAEEIGIIQTVIEELIGTRKIQVSMDLVPAPTRKRKGKPASHSSLSDEKREGSDNDPEFRQIRPATNRRKAAAKDDDPEEDISLYNRLEDRTPRIKNKFWKDVTEETLSATSSDEDKESLKGPRKKAGPPMKKKKKRQHKGSVKEERIPGSHPRMTSKPPKPEGKGCRRPPESEPEGSL